MKLRKIKKTVCAFLAVLLFLSSFPVNHRAHALTQREKIAQVALGEVGVSGRPNKYTYWYGSSGGSYSYAWCAVFISWCAAQAGVSQSVIHKNASAVLNEFGTPYYKYTSSFNVRKGDILYVKNNVSLHVGLVVDVDKNYIYTVEGNMSDSVKLVTYSRSSGYTTWSGSYQWQRILYVGVPDYPDELTESRYKTAYYGGSRYEVFKKSVKWERAAELCESLGGHLVTVTSKGENEAVAALASAAGKNCWLALSDSDKEGSWKWLTGEETRYKAWADGQPDNKDKAQDYAALNYKTGKWQDESASATAYFICEYDDALTSDAQTLDKASNHTYVLYTDKLTWDEAVSFCEYKGGHLLTVNDAREQTALLDFLKKNKVTVWAGGKVNSTEKKWEWATGERLDYTNWDEEKLAKNGKHGTRLEIAADGGWNEASPEKRQGFICEFEHTHIYCDPVITKKATTDENGIYTYQCKCGYSYEKAIKKIDTVKLSSDEVVYNGNVRTPTVTVKNSAGSKLTEGTDYTVSYASGRKNVGKYKITVKFKGKYTGSEALYLRIVPKATSFTSLTPGKKKATLKWKAVSGVSGYEVYYYSTACGYYVKDGSTTKTSYSFKDLISKKTYSVKVRSYKTVDGEKLYSPFSAVKKVKAK